MPLSCAAASASQIWNRIATASGSLAAPRAAAIGQRLALQPLHDEVAAPVGQRAEREDVDDVRVADLIDRARLLHEALDLHRVDAELAAHHLDGDLLADDRLYARVDRGHAALAELGLDAILADDGARPELAVDLQRHAGPRLRCVRALLGVMGGGVGRRHRSVDGTESRRESSTRARRSLHLGGGGRGSDTVRAIPPRRRLVSDSPRKADTRSATPSGSSSHGR